jgi:hypothetical protein
MDVNTYLEPVVEQLHAAAALGDDRTQQIAAGLSEAVRSSVRLALLSAVSAAADEITAALLDADVDGSPTVTVALDGEDVRIQVRVASAQPAAEGPRPDDGDLTARISLRLPEALKSEVDHAAAHESISVNTWLVRAAATALAARSGSGASTGRGAHRITGWVTG